jgi:hypothetical protein
LIRETLFNLGKFSLLALAFPTAPATARSVLFAFLSKLGAARALVLFVAKYNFGFLFKIATVFLVRTTTFGLLTEPTHVANTAKGFLAAVLATIRRVDALRARIGTICGSKRG